METAMPLDRALHLAVRMVAPSRLAKAIEAIPPEARMSKPLSQTLGATGHLPPPLLAALENAERTGDTAGSLRHLADLYEAGAF
jgi:type II secretory pathway component PulF